MGYVQYVGFPVVTDKALIKYGYQPTRYGYVWVVTVKDRETEEEHKSQYATRQEAVAAVDTLTKYYGG